MQSKRVWARLLGVERGVIIERVDGDEDRDDIVVSCRLRRGRAGRCGECGRRCAGYDHGAGRRHALGNVERRATRRVAVPEGRGWGACGLLVAGGRWCPIG